MLHSYYSEKKSLYQERGFLAKIRSTSGKSKKVASHVLKKNEGVKMESRGDGSWSKSIPDEKESSLDILEKQLAIGKGKEAQMGG